MAVRLLARGEQLLHSPAFNVQVFMAGSVAKKGLSGYSPRHAVRAA
jgi:hypothetical protein